MNVGSGITERRRFNRCVILDNVFIGFGLDVGEVRLSKFCLAQFGDCEGREISVEVKWIKDCLKF